MTVLLNCATAKVSVEKKVYFLHNHFNMTNIIFCEVKSGIVWLIFYLMFIVT